MTPRCGGGRVAEKHSEHVSCEHSYDCNCHQACSGTGSSRSCSEQCDTCYEHLYDVDWVVTTSNEEHIDIDRADRQGLRTPARWEATRVGEPTAVVHSYDNYVKGAPGTLFRRQGEGASTGIRYPQAVYDYYRYDRLVTQDVTVRDVASWDQALAELDADVGRTKQANALVVLVKDEPEAWYYRLEEEWVGGKKNDVVLVASVDAEMHPQWAHVMCWTTNELFKVKLRDDVMAHPVLTKDAVVDDMRTNVVSYFERKPMHDFEYLKAEITPTTTEWAISLILGLVAAVGLAILFHTQDVFGERGFNRARYTLFNPYGR